MNIGLPPFQIVAPKERYNEIMDNPLKSNSEKPADEDKKKIKEILMQKIKVSAMKGEANPSQAPPPPLTKNEPRGPTRVDTEEDFRKMPYEGKAKYDNQLKTLSALKNQTSEPNLKLKRMFFQHYDISEPYCPVIQNNTNPSGRPPNIPPEMYEGVTVKPKRPWVYLGNQNMPPVEYEGLNQSNFKSMQRRTVDVQEPRRKQEDHAALAGRKKAGVKAEREKERDQFREDDEQSINLSDEIAMEDGESIFASKYDTEHRANRSKTSRRSSGLRNSELYMEEDDELVSDGTETKKRNLSMFKCSSGEEECDDHDEGEEEKNKSSRVRGKKEAKNKKKEPELSSDEG